MEILGEKGAKTRRVGGIIEYIYKESIGSMSEANDKREAIKQVGKYLTPFTQQIQGML